ncbi:hypothetical protein CW696_03210 [ANME-2 cluster archaeon]|nr:MAG: hypothetical protein CW696_03210 [ANME-2 cluster archaeon]
MSTHHDCDGLLRAICGYGTPTRNDCGYPDRYNHEDSSRMHGWGVEGKGACDYPDGCEMFENGECPFYDREKMVREMQAEQSA